MGRSSVLSCMCISTNFPYTYKREGERGRERGREWLDDESEEWWQLTGQRKALEEFGNTHQTGGTYL